ncbi:unnamed protein product [Toxocara canis]|uniref:Histidine ammonia-lyase n=1 Tax=Toxocara canis TaxID=6265 RepID=A0A183TV90_TOXCA|nr:unnamed protein product [Toxocara canis]
MTEVQGFEDIGAKSLCYGDAVREHQDILDSSNQAVCSMAELMDCFIIPPVINDSLIANPFVGYGKSEQLAMLAFHVARVLQLRPNECPLSEAYTVLGLLKAHELGFISSL